MGTRVWLVDDHAVVRRGVAALLEREGDLEVVGESSTAADALSYVPRHRPDVVVLDVRLPDGSGVEVCRQLLSQIAGLRPLMLTSYSDDDAMLNAHMAGASGFVLKEVAATEVVSAVRAVSEGENLLDQQRVHALMARLRNQARDDPVRRLTPQERAVLELIGEGLTNRQIGQHLYLAEKTVKNYVSTVLHKLGLQRRTQAAVLAFERKDHHI